ncbi:MAG: methyltransferase [Prevotella sp.]|nr:methyltransferase [Prevotella sp.]
MFKFKYFTIWQDRCAMKVGTDGVLLGAWAHRGSRILDVGTGTGLIALMMAQRSPQAQVVAVDIDEDAVSQAQENVAAARCEDRITVVHSSVQELGKREGYQGTFDVIVSNPPFFIDSLNAPDQQRNMARHADTLTYGELMEAAWKLLSDEGELSVVVPFDYRQRMEDEATFRGFFPSRICAVRTVEGKPAKRYLLAFRKHPCERVHQVMTIGDAEYKRLTQDFYI